MTQLGEFRIDPQALAQGNALPSAVAPLQPRRAMEVQGELWSNPSRAQSAADEDEGAYPQSGPKILVVEDEVLIGMGIAIMLENAGFETHGPVGDVRSAMQLLDAENCALAILDVNLARGETSAPLAERLRSSGIPFLVMSGDGALEGATVFAGAPNLPKPVGARMLVAAVQHALG